MYMRTELIKIIEGGLEKNPEKVKSYAKLVAEKFVSEGDEKFANRILSILDKKSVHPVYLDEFLSKPVDKESRLPMVDITIEPKVEEIVLPKVVEEKVNTYIESLNKRDKFLKLGLDLPESLLLFGPPGCGKTTIAHLISAKTGLPLITAKLDGLVSSLLGSTAKNIGKIFEYAQERPCILFLDEFDAIAKARNDSQEVGELKRVVNSLLQNIDNFNENNILIAATNHEKMLDPAVWRRFTNIIEIPKPTEVEIVDLIGLNTSLIKVDFIKDAKKMVTLSRMMEGLSPSEIKSICYNAIKRSMLKEETTLSYATFLYQIFLSKSDGKNNDLVSLISFLNKNGISQINISKMLNISQRQVRKILNNEGEDQE